VQDRARDLRDVELRAVRGLDRPRSVCSSNVMKRSAVLEPVKGLNSKSARLAAAALSSAGRMPSIGATQQQLASAPIPGALGPFLFRKLSWASVFNRCQTKQQALHQLRQPYSVGAIGGLAFSRLEMAVTSWAGANGFVSRTLLGTPRDGHWSWRPNYYRSYGFYPVPRFGHRHWDWHHRGWRRW
jgi:hypothetical protein